MTRVILVLMMLATVSALIDDGDYAEEELLRAEEDDYFSDFEEFQEVEKRALELKKKAYVHEELEEGGTDQSVIEEIPVYIHAHKMARLLSNQDVVATCRYMLFKTMKNYYDALEHCRTVEWPFTHNGIGMASVQNEADNTDIRVLLQIAFGIKFNHKPYDRNNWVWVGLEKHTDRDRDISDEEEGNWNPEHWKWSDGSDPTYTNWRKDQPDQQWSRKFKTYQNWVMINKRGYWDDTHAGFEAPFACNYCGKYIVIETPVSWDKAKELCEEYGLTMAKVNSVEDNQELAWAANITFGEEIHDTRWNKTNWIWLGTEEVMDPNTGNGTNSWEHHDGTELMWDPVWDRRDQPDNWTVRKGEQSKVAFSRLDTKWDDSYSWKHRPFACMCPHHACHYAE